MEKKKFEEDIDRTIFLLQEGFKIIQQENGEEKLSKFIKKHGFKNNKNKIK
jgi:hypothetical protein|tara:strand:- start:342 stop:494 length:153 start_codon:yes stop_codon:yes gene_type:complete